MTDTKVPMDKILLVGDTIIDINTQGHLLGTSSETPTIIMSKDSENLTHGGAALVHRNLRQLKCKHQFITGIHKDDLSKENSSLTYKNSEITYVPLKKKTTVKHRFWCDKYKLLQIDTLDNHPISPSEAQKVYKLISQSDADVIAISDYRHGFLSPKLIDLINTSNKRIILDSQVSQSRANHNLYKHLYLTILNEREAQQFAPNVFWSNSQVWKHALFDNIDSENFIVKFGKRGCIYLSKTQGIDSLHVATDSIDNPVDTTGAGDAFLGALLSKFYLIDSDLKTLLDFAVSWATRSVMVKGANPPDA